MSGCVSNRPVFVSGTPRLTLIVGGEQRTTTGERIPEGLSYETTELWFRYDVQSADLDVDGIGIDADALQGAIRDASHAPAMLDLGRHAVENAHGHRVDGRTDYMPQAVAHIYSSPPGRDVYGVGDVISVNVGFGEQLTLLGSPSFALKIGDAVRPMQFEGCSGPTDAPKIGKGDCGGLHFSYVVQAGDYDADGIEIQADALAQGGAALRDDGGNYAILELPPTVFPDQRVDGRRPLPTTVAKAYLRSYPQRNEVFTLEEIIRLTISFHRRVKVTGRPGLRLRIGADVREAFFVGCLRQQDTEDHMVGTPVSGSGPCRQLLFEHTVQPNDYGPRIDVLDLRLHGGAISDENDVPAETAFGDSINAHLARHSVDGAIDRAPRVTYATFEYKEFGHVYRVGETVRALVRFDEAVSVVGSPWLVIAIGAERHRAVYSGCLQEGARGCRQLWFDYVVQPEDRDMDGVTIASRELDLNGGAIFDQSGYAANTWLAGEAGEQAGFGDGGRVDGSSAVDVDDAEAVRVD